MVPASPSDTVGSSTEINELSSFKIVKVAPSVISISPEATVFGTKLDMLINTVSSGSAFESPIGFTPKLSVSPAVPAKDKVKPLTDE